MQRKKNQTSKQASMMRLSEYPLLLSLSSSSSLGHLFILLILTVTTITGMMILLNKKNHHSRLPPSPPALPIIGHLHLLSPLLHQSVAALSSKYGPLLYLRMGSVPCIVVSNSNLAKKFLKANELNFCSRKDNIAMTRLSYQKSSMAFSPYGEYWKTMRKMSHNVLFGARSLDRFHSIRTKELHWLLHNIYTQSLLGNNSNVTEELSKLSFNTISQMILGVRASGTDSVGDKARKLACEAIRIFGEFNVSDFIWFCKFIDFQGIGRRSEYIYHRYDALIEDVIQQHREESRKKEVNKSIAPSTKENNDGESIDDDVKDFLSAVLDIMEEEENGSEIHITRAHIKALILDYFMAGTDNIAAVIEWCLAELINNPKILEKARLEIDSVVGTTRLVQEYDIKNLPYIQAIVKEALRLHPPAPMFNRKSTEECEINGYMIPSHALVFINIWAIGRDPNVWAKPMEFDPERFLGPNGNSSMDVSGQQFEFLPFGSGRRGCPGISLAMLEVPVTVAAMIQCFDWKFGCVGSGSNNNNKIDMVETSGATARRVNQLVSIPTVRFDFSSLLVI